MKELWTLKHRHQHEGPRKVGDGKLTTVIKDLLVQKLESKASVRLKMLRIDDVFSIISTDKRASSSWDRRA